MGEAEHPTLDQLTAFDLGKLRPSEWEVIERHISRCDVCCSRLEGIPDDRLISLMRATLGNERESLQ